MLKLLKIAAFAIPAFAMLSLAEPASAGEAATAAASAKSVQAKAPGTQKICINIIPDTGSRMARRTCKTRAEWAEEGLDLDARK